MAYLLVNPLTRQPQKSVNGDKIGGTSAESSSKLDFLHSVCTIFASR